MNPIKIVGSPEHRARYKTIRSSNPSRNIGNIIEFLSSTGPKRGRVTQIRHDYNALPPYDKSAKLLTVDTYIIY